MWITFFFLLEGNRILSIARHLFLEQLSSAWYQALLQAWRKWQARSQEQPCFYQTLHSRVLKSNCCYYIQFIYSLKFCLLILTHSERRKWKCPTIITYFITVSLHFYFWILHLASIISSSSISIITVIIIIIGKCLPLFLTMNDFILLGVLSLNIICLTLVLLLLLIFVCALTC